MEHARGERREVESIGQSPIEVLTEVVKGLGARLDTFNEYIDTLRPDEVAEIRKLLPQLADMIESRKRWKWFWGRVAAVFLGGPALVTMGAALWQLGVKIAEWIREH